jgi:CBS domain-containing protein
MTIASLLERQSFKVPPFCTSGTTVFDAAVKIAKIDVNALAVVEDDLLIGIITDHDIIRCLADSGDDFRDQLVQDWMTEKPVTCMAGTKLTAALKLMAGRGIRHLPVLENGRPKAVISSKELLTQIHENDELEISVLRDLARVGQVSLA